MSIEFKWAPWSKYHPRIFEPVELDETFEVVREKRGRKTVSNGKIAFDIVSRGRVYDRLLADYQKQLTKAKSPVAIIASEPLRQTVEAPIVAPAPVAVTPVASATTAVIDEKAESEEFVQVSGEEKYVPSPDEWFEARVVKSHNPKLLTLELTTGDRLPCVPAFVTDSPGGHVLCLPVGTIGSVRLELFQGYYRALEFRVDGEPASLDEKARIIRWRHEKNNGKAERVCGCHLWIVSAHDDWVHGTIDVGDWVVYRLERSRTRGNWVGVGAKKIQGERT